MSRSSPENEFCFRKLIQFFLDFSVLSFVIFFSFIGAQCVRVPCVFKYIAYRETMFENDNIVIFCQNFECRLIFIRLTSGILNPNVVIIIRVVVPSVWIRFRKVLFRYTVIGVVGFILFVKPTGNCFLFAQHSQIGRAHV